MTNFYDDLEHHGESIAFITQDSECISYRKLASDADVMGREIEGRHLIFALVKNDIESIVGYLGALRFRAVPVLISPDIHPTLLHKLIETYRPDFIWLAKDNEFSLSEYLCIFTYRGYCLMKGAPFNYSLHDSLAQLLTTSGSTGSPKLVRQSYLNINSNVDSIAKSLNISNFDRPITTLPMSYTFGLSIITSHLLNGCTILLNNYTLMEKSFWEMFKAYEATTFGGVPYIFEMLKKLRFSRMNLPSLKVITQAGGKLPRVIAEEFAATCDERGIKFVIMYGQTEATARMAYLPSEYLKCKPSSIGIPIPGGKFWLEGENRQVINDPDVVGELVYSGPNVCMGYSLGFEDLCRGDEMHGVLHTGDMAKRDEDGFYYIAGRKGRFLKIFGKRVNLDEVQQLLANANFDCACSGRDDHLKIYLVEQQDTSGVIRYLTEHTGIHSAGFEVVTVDQLPRNEAGKILYEQLEIQG